MTSLTTRLRAGWRLEDALRAFADDFDDTTADLVAAALVIAGRLRGSGLVRVLESVADTVADDVRIRRAIEADRASARSSARWITVITALLLTGLFLSPFAQAYRTPGAQVVLLVLLAGYAGSLLLMRRIVTADRLPRFLHQRLDAGERHDSRAARRGAGRPGLLRVRSRGAARPSGPRRRARPAAPHPPGRHLRTTSALVPGRWPGPLETRLGNWLEVQLRGRGWGGYRCRTWRFCAARCRGSSARRQSWRWPACAAATVLAACLAVLGQALPVPVPVLAALLLAAALWFVPDIGVHRDAVAARQEFACGVAAYIDLTALQLAGGAGTTQGLEEAARVGDSWVFARLREELGAAALAGRTPWTASPVSPTTCGCPSSRTWRTWPASPGRAAPRCVRLAASPIQGAAGRAAEPGAHQGQRGNQPARAAGRAVRHRLFDHARVPGGHHDPTTTAPSPQERKGAHPDAPTHRPAAGRDHRRPAAAWVCADLRTRDEGAPALEYIILAALILVAVVAMATYVVSRIVNYQNQLP